jgi:hypothetical protein
MARNQKDFTFDYDLRLKDAGVIAASAAAQVGGVDKILDVGAARVDGRVIVDTTAVEVDSGNELYQVVVQGSSSATFASGIVTLGEQRFGDSSVTLETVDSPAAARREIAFTNEQNGTVYRYIRVYTIIAGTIATGINYVANAVIGVR